jgi:hypothetical protein
MMYIVIQPQSYHTTRQISIALSGLKQKLKHCIAVHDCFKHAAGQDIFLLG